MPETVIVVANGDLRLSANQVCWPAQKEAEAAVMAAIRNQGREVKRGHPEDPVKKHGFIDSQKYGMQVFRDIPSDAPLVVVEAVSKRFGSTPITCFMACTATAGRSSPSPIGADSGLAWSAC